jgi:uncharacterized membrane protein YeaQ/YmgE (transglycosylase-associated protein family)
MIVGLIAGAIAGALIRSEQRFGCLGTMFIGIFGGLLGGWLWVEVLGQEPATGWLGAIVVAVLGSMIVILGLRAINRG